MSRDSVYIVTIVSLSVITLACIVSVTMQPSSQYVAPMVSIVQAAVSAIALLLRSPVNPPTK